MGTPNGVDIRKSAKRHDVLKGFEETDILPFGGLLEKLVVDPGTEIPMTFIPQFPVYPPETAWMRVPETDIPGLVLNITDKGSRIAFLPADLDRQYARFNLPDHGNLLKNLVTWAVKGNLPLMIEGPGLVDCHLYSQPGRLVLHLVNLTNAATWRQPLEELVPIGPFRVRIKLQNNVRGSNVRLLVSNQAISAKPANGWSDFMIKQITDHEVVVLS